MNGIVPPVAAFEMNTLGVRDLGLRDYQTVWKAMQKFTDERDENTPDELWLLEHPAVFTQGQAGKAEHLLAPADIPVIQVDRGGQVTYHGPGQIVAYPLIDIKRRSLNVRQLVQALERAVINTLAAYQIKAECRQGAPGVYVEDAKIASIGLRIRRGCSFHGLALNVDMDTEPFSRINPCGYQGLQVIQMQALSSKTVKLEEVKSRLVSQLAEQLEYTGLQKLAAGIGT